VVTGGAIRELAGGGGSSKGKTAVVVMAQTQYPRENQVGLGFEEGKKKANRNQMLSSPCDRVNRQKRYGISGPGGNRQEMKSNTVVVLDKKGYQRLLSMRLYRC